MSVYTTLTKLGSLQRQSAIRNHKQLIGKIILTALGGSDRYHLRVNHLCSVRSRRPVRGTGRRQGRDSTGVTAVTASVTGDRPPSVHDKWARTLVLDKQTPDKICHSAGRLTQPQPQPRPRGSSQRSQGHTRRRCRQGQWTSARGRRRHMQWHHVVRHTNSSSLRIMDMGSVTG